MDREEGHSPSSPWEVPIGPCSTGACGECGMLTPMVICQQAVKNEDMGAIQSHVQRYGVEMRGKNGFQVLHFAACYGKLGITKKLLQDMGADVNARTDRGNTALHIACFENIVPMIELLVREGADTGVLNGQNKDCADLAPRAYTLQHLTRALCKRNGGTIRDPSGKLYMHYYRVFGLSIGTQEEHLFPAFKQLLKHIFVKRDATDEQLHIDLHEACEAYLVLRSSHNRELFEQGPTAGPMSIEFIDHEYLLNYIKEQMKNALGESLLQRSSSPALNPCDNAQHRNIDLHDSASTVGAGMNAGSHPPESPLPDVSIMSAASASSSPMVSPCVPGPKSESCPGHQDTTRTCDGPSAHDPHPQTSERTAEKSTSPSHASATSASPISVTSFSLSQWQTATPRKRDLNEVYERDKDLSKLASFADVFVETASDGSAEDFVSFEPASLQAESRSRTPSKPMPGPGRLEGGGHVPDSRDSREQDCACAFKLAAPGPPRPPLAPSPHTDACSGIGMVVQCGHEPAAVAPAQQCREEEATFQPWPAPPLQAVGSAQGLRDAETEHKHEHSQSHKNEWESAQGTTARKHAAAQLPDVYTQLPDVHDALGSEQQRTEKTEQSALSETTGCDAQEQSAAHAGVRQSCSNFRTRALVLQQCPGHEQAGTGGSKAGGVMNDNACHCPSIHSGHPRSSISAIQLEAVESDLKPELKSEPKLEAVGQWRTSVQASGGGHEARDGGGAGRHGDDAVVGARQGEEARGCSEEACESSEHARLLALLRTLLAQKNEEIASLSQSLQHAVASTRALEHELIGSRQADARARLRCAELSEQVVALEERNEKINALHRTHVVKSHAQVQRLHEGMEEALRREAELEGRRTTAECAQKLVVQHVMARLREQEGCVHEYEQLLQHVLSEKLDIKQRLAAFNHADLASARGSSEAPATNVAPEPPAQAGAAKHGAELCTADASLHPPRVAQQQQGASRSRVLQTYGCGGVQASACSPFSSSSPPPSHAASPAQQAREPLSPHPPADYGLLPVSASCSPAEHLVAPAPSPAPTPAPSAGRHYGDRSPPPEEAAAAARRFKLCAVRSARLSALMRGETHSHSPRAAPCSPDLNAPPLINVPQWRHAKAAGVRQHEHAPPLQDGKSPTPAQRTHLCSTPSVSSAVSVSPQLPPPLLSRSCRALSGAQASSSDQTSDWV